MLKTGKVKALFLSMLAVLAVACGGSEYIEEARERAIVAAQALVNSNHDDIMEMERLILDAKSIQSEYILKGDTLAAREFDTCFQNYLTANDSQLAKEIFK